MGLKINIKKKFRGFTLDIKLESDSDFLGILGASGSGKTMTLKCIAGVETPDEGYIILNDKILFDSHKKINLKPQERNIGYLFQNYALFPNMTVRDNIGAGLKISKSQRKPKIDKIIQAFHLEGLENKFPNQLSGGQQQRVALARSIIYEPDVLMLDEPFSALDTHLKEQLQENITDLLSLYKGELLLVSHSMDEVYKFCNKITIIEDGCSILTGDTKDIFRNPKLYSVAKIMGYKNISKCEVMNPSCLYLSKWDIYLNLENDIPQNTKYIGLRENEFHILDSQPINDHHKSQNTLLCSVEKVVEDIMKYNVFFDVRNNFENIFYDKNIKNHKPHHLKKSSYEVRKTKEKDNLIFKVNKNEWNNRNLKDIFYLQIPQKSIILLE